MLRVITQSARCLAAGLLLSASAVAHGDDVQNALEILNDTIGLVLPSNVDLGASITGTAPNQVLNLWGSTTLTVAGQSIAIALGSTQTPGIVLNETSAGWQVSTFDGSLTEDFTLDGLTIKTGDDGVAVGYHPTSGGLSLTGQIDVTFDGQQISATLGDTTDPGIVLSIGDDGSTALDSLDIDVAENFTLFGLNLQTTPNVGFDFQYNAASSRYEVFGGLQMTVEGQTLGVSMGDKSHPGLILSAGVVQQINMSTSEDIKVAGFSFDVPSSNPIDIELQRENDDAHFLISGEVILSDLWKAELALGTEAHPGLKIDNGIWDVESLDIQLDKINLGFVNLEEIAVDYSRPGGALDLAIDLSVSVPEFGEITADVTVVDGMVDDIALNYQVAGSGTGLEILDTGVDIAEIGADLTNLDQTANLGINGTIGIEFGGQLDIEETEVTLIRVNGDVTIDSNELKMNDTFLLGAYQSNGDWQSILFDGQIIVNLDWSDDTYYFDGSIYLPTDYGLFFDAQLLITQRLVDALITAGVRIPTYIPVIGGLMLSDIGVGVRMDDDAPVNDYAAAWTQFIFWTIGVEYAWNANTFSFLDGAQVSEIETEITDDIVGVSLFADGDMIELLAADTSITHNFVIPDGADAVSLWVSWPETVTSLNIGATGPTSAGADQQLCVEPLDLSGGGASASGEASDCTVTLVPDAADGGVRLFLYRDTADNNLLEGDSAGDLDVTVTLLLDTIAGSTVTFDQIDAEAIGQYRNSSVETPALTAPDAQASGLDRAFLEDALETADSGPTQFAEGDVVSVDLSYWAHPLHADDATLTLFVDSDGQGYDGVPVLRNIPYGSHSNNGGAQTVTFKAQAYLRQPHDHYRLYARIDAPGRSPVYSDYSAPMSVSPSVYGSLLDTARGDLPLSGIRVFIDVNDNGSFDVGEPTQLTSAEGRFAFPGLAAGTYHIGLVQPDGYALVVGAGGEAGRIVEVDADPSSPRSLTFHVNLLRSIQGLLYADLDRNDQRDADEPPLVGARLFLDLNENGRYDRREPRADTLRDGSFRFHNVEGDTDYQVRLYLPDFPSTVANSVGSYQLSAPFSSVYEVRTSSGEFTHSQIPPIGVPASRVLALTTPKFVTWAYEALKSVPPELRGPTDDPDGDGFDNYTEFLAGTDPTNPFSVPEGVRPRPIPIPTVSHYALLLLTLLLAGFASLRLRRQG